MLFSCVTQIILSRHKVPWLLGYLIQVQNFIVTLSSCITNQITNWSLVLLARHFTDVVPSLTQVYKLGTSLLLELTYRLLFFNLCHGKCVYRPSSATGCYFSKVTVAWGDLEYFYSPLDEVLVHHRVTPRIKLTSTYLYTWAERGTDRVNFLALVDDAMSLDKTRTWTAQSGSKHTNHDTY